jgi:CRISPR-associated protein Cas1
MVYSVVLSCIIKRIIQQDDFDVELGGAHRLSPDARRHFLLQYEERKNTEFKHPIFGYHMTYQRCFELQARLLGKYLQGELDAYPPLMTK